MVRLHTSTQPSSPVNNHDSSPAPTPAPAFSPPLASSPEIKSAPLPMSRSESSDPLLLVSPPPEDTSKRYPTRNRTPVTRFEIHHEPQNTSLPPSSVSPAPTSYRDPTPLLESSDEDDNLGGDQLPVDEGDVTEEEFGFMSFIDGCEYAYRVQANVDEPHVELHDTAKSYHHQ